MSPMTPESVTEERALATPGILGRAVRAAAGLLTLSLADPLFGAWSGLKSGMIPMSDAGFWGGFAAVAFFSSWVVGELLQRDWGFWPSVVGITGAALTAAVGFFATGDFATAALGTYIFAWFAAFIILLAPAMFLAAILGTPGCEMRSYAHLAALLRGGDTTQVACPGGIDFLDHVRVFGK